MKNPKNRKLEESIELPFKELDLCTNCSHIMPPKQNKTSYKDCPLIEKKSEIYESLPAALKERFRLFDEQGEMCPFYQILREKRLNNPKKY